MTMEERTKELYLDYIEGKLTKEQRVVCEKQMLEDARLRNLVAHMIRDRNRIRSLAEEPAPLDLMQGVQQRLEREMLLGPPVGQRYVRSGQGSGYRIMRLGLVSTLAAMILVAAAVVVDSMMPSPLIRDWANFANRSAEPPPRSLAQHTAPEAGAVPPAEESELAQQPPVPGQSATEAPARQLLRDPTADEPLGPARRPDDQPASRPAAQDGRQAPAASAAGVDALEPAPQPPTALGEGADLLRGRRLDERSAADADVATGGETLSVDASMSAPRAEARSRRGVSADLFAQTDDVERADDGAGLQRLGDARLPLPPAPASPRGELRKMLDNQPAVTRLDIVADAPQTARQRVRTWAQEHEAVIMAGGDESEAPIVLKLRAGQINGLLREMNAAAGQAATLRVQPVAAPTVTTDAAATSDQEPQPFVHWWRYLADELPMPSTLRLHRAETPVEVTIQITAAAPADEDEPWLDDVDVE
jgi:hypothetical protein